MNKSGQAVFMAAYPVTAVLMQERIEKVRFRLGFSAKRSGTLARGVPLIPALLPFRANEKTAKQFAVSDAFGTMRLMGHDGVRIGNLIICSHNGMQAVGFEVECSKMIEAAARNARLYLQQGGDYASTGHFGSNLPEGKRILLVCCGNGLFGDRNGEKLVAEYKFPPLSYNRLRLNLYRLGRFGWELNTK